MSRDNVRGHDPSRSTFVLHPYPTPHYTTADAPPPFVGPYPYRASGKTATTTLEDGERARRKAEEQSIAANIALHYAIPPLTLANEDPVVAQGLHYPQR